MNPNSKHSCRNILLNGEERFLENTGLKRLWKFYTSLTSSCSHTARSKSSLRAPVMPGSVQRQAPASALMFFSKEGIKGSNAAPTESHGLNCYSCREEHWRRQWLHHACNTFRAAFNNVLKLGSEDLSTVESVHPFPVFQTPLVQCCIVWETRVLTQSLGFGIHDQLELEVDLQCLQGVPSWDTCPQNPAAEW